MSRTLDYVANMTAEQRRRAVGKFRILAERYLEDLENGAVAKVTIDIREKYRAIGIPRGAAELYNGSPSIICGLLGEVEDRDEVLAKARLAIMAYANTSAITPEHDVRLKALVAEIDALIGTSTGRSRG